MLYLDFISLIRELCLYFSSFGYLAGGVKDPGCVPVLFSLAAVSGLCGMILKEKGNLCWISVLPVCCAFLDPACRSHWVMVLPVIAYLAVRIRNGIYGAEYSAVKTVLVRGCVLEGVLLAVILLFAADLLPAVKTAAAPYFGLFFLLSIYEMRMRRNSGSPVSSDRHYALLNLAPVILIALIGAAALSKTAQQMMKALLKLFYIYVILPPLYLFIRLIIAFFWLMRYPVLWLMSLFKPSFNMEEALSEFGTIEDSQFYEVTFGEGSGWVELVIRTLIVAAFLLVCWYVLRQISRRRETGYSAGTYTRESLPAKKKEKGFMSFLLRQPDPVREAYRQYLRLCEKADIPADGRLASDQIMNQTEMYLHTKDAARLRQLWLPVRYGEKKSTGAAEAKELLRKLRKAFRLRETGQQANVS